MKKLKQFSSIFLVILSLLILTLMIYAKLEPSRLSRGMAINILGIETMSIIFLVSLGLLRLGIYLSTFKYGKWLIRWSLLMFLMISYIYWYMPPWVEHIHYLHTSLYQYYPARGIFFIISGVIALTIGLIGWFLKQRNH